MSILEWEAIANGGCDDLEGCLEVESWSKGEVSLEDFASWFIAPAVVVAARPDEARRRVERLRPVSSATGTKFCLSPCQCPLLFTGCPSWGAEPDGTQDRSLNQDDREDLSAFHTPSQGLVFSDSSFTKEPQKKFSVRAQDHFRETAPKRWDGR